MRRKHPLSFLPERRSVLVIIDYIPKRAKGGATVSGPPNGTLGSLLFYAFQRSYHVSTRTPTLTTTAPPNTSATSSLPSKQSSKPNVVGVSVGASLGRVIVLAGLASCLRFWRKWQSDKAKPLKEAGEPAHTKVSEMPGKTQDPRELLSELVLELESPPVELPNSEAWPHSQV